MQNSIAHGRVRHVRLGARPRRFSYAMTMSLVDVEQIGEMFSVPPLTGRSWSVCALRRRDYLADADGQRVGDLKDAVLHRVAKLGFAVPAKARVFLLTMPASLGYGFNPVSFYLVLDAEGRARFLLAEITNTPWDERHSYCLPFDDSGSRVHSRFTKAFHISPFQPMGQEYEWSLRLRQDHIQIHMRNYQDGACIFNVTMDLTLTPASRWTQAWAAIRHPVMSLRAAFGIYLQAAILWCRGFKFYDHP